MKNNLADFEVIAPGRVNLAGGHTDYNGLPVLPMAMEQSIRIEGRIRDDAAVHVSAKVVPGEQVEFQLQAPIPKHPRGHWANYVKAGMQGVLESPFWGSHEKICGCDLSISGTIPQGVGLSSSSALVVASALALLHANGRKIDPILLAERMAEAEYYVGTRGGGMDQATCLAGKAGHVLKIDFFPLRIKPVLWPDSIAIIVCDSLIRANKTQNALLAYNKRALECKLAALLLHVYLCAQGQTQPFARLGDLFNPPWSMNYEQLSELIAEALLEEYDFEQILEQTGNENQVIALLKDYSFTDESAFSSLKFACGKRYRHIANDGRIVEQSLTQLQAGNAESFGRLMDEGHTSERDDYEISSPDLNRLVEAAKESGALGSRLTGAGFGGCTVSVVRVGDIDRVISGIEAGYYADLDAETRSRNSQPVFVSTPAEGARAAALT